MLFRSIEKQAQRLQEAERAIDEKLLLTNILRSATGTALLASDLSHRISYATPAVADVLGVRPEQIGGHDIRNVLRQLGWEEADAALGEAPLAGGAKHYTVTFNGIQEVDLQVSLLLDAQNNAQGYLVLAQTA